MSDELENVEAGSETSGEEAAETSQEVTAAEATDAPAEQSEESAADAGGAAEAEESGSETSEVAVDGSRTGFVENGQSGGECICPDGRKGTIHKFDAGLVC